MMTTNALSAAQALNSPVPAGPVNQFCDRYVDLTLDFAWWFLLAALLIGAIGALVMAFNPLKAEGKANGESGGAIQQTAAAITGLIEAFSKAPTWLAMLGGGLFLLWMAATAIPDCGTSTERTSRAESSGTAPLPVGQAQRNINPESSRSNSSSEAGGAR